jgi:hypothetical protein
MRGMAAISIGCVLLCCSACEDETRSLRKDVRELGDEISHLNKELRKQSDRLARITKEEVTLLEIIGNYEHYQDRTFVRSIPCGIPALNSGTISPIRAPSSRGVPRVFGPKVRTHHMMCCWDLVPGVGDDPVWDYPAAVLLTKTQTDEVNASCRTTPPNSESVLSDCRGCWLENASLLFFALGSFDGHYNPPVDYQAPPIFMLLEI